MADFMTTKKATRRWPNSSRITWSIQRNPEFFAEHAFDAFEIFFHEDELFLDVCKPLQKLVDSLVNSCKLFAKRSSVFASRLSTAARILISCAVTFSSIRL